jgi:recombination protein RecA
VPIDLDDVKAINKKYALHKEHQVVARGDQVPPQPVEWIRTGCPSIDLALGRGVPKGRVIELYGQPGGGKTSVALLVAEAVQREGGDVLYIDAEYAMNPEWRAKLSQDQLHWCEPEYGEQAWDIAGAFIEKGVDLVVVDSIATLTPRAEAEGSMEEHTRGALARMMGQAMRTIAPMVYRSGSILVCVNQIRSGMSQYEPEVRPGGKSLPYSASICAKVSRDETLKDGAEPIGQRVKVQVTKNKVAPPGKIGYATVYYSGERAGIDKLQGLLDAGLQTGVLIQKGPYIYFSGVQLGQGAAKAKDALRQDSEMIDAITTAIYSENGI